MEFPADTYTHLCTLLWTTGIPKFITFFVAISVAAPPQDTMSDDVYRVNILIRLSFIVCFDCKTTRCRREKLQLRSQDKDRVTGVDKGVNGLTPPVWRSSSSIWKWFHYGWKHLMNLSGACGDVFGASGGDCVRQFGVVEIILLWWYLLSDHQLWL